MLSFLFFVPRFRANFTARAFFLLIISARRPYGESLKRSYFFLFREEVPPSSWSHAGLQIQQKGCGPICFPGPYLYVCLHAKIVLVLLLWGIHGGALFFSHFFEEGASITTASITIPSGRSNALFSGRTSTSSKSLSLRP